MERKNVAQILFEKKKFPLVTNVIQNLKKNKNLSTEKPGDFNLRSTKIFFDLFDFFYHKR